MDQAIGSRAVDPAHGRGNSQRQSPLDAGRAGGDVHVESWRLTRSLREEVGWECVCGAAFSVPLRLGEIDKTSQEKLFYVATLQRGDESVIYVPNDRTSADTKSHVFDRGLINLLINYQENTGRTFVADDSDIVKIDKKTAERFAQEMIQSPAEARASTESIVF